MTPAAAAGADGAAAAAGAAGVSGALGMAVSMAKESLEVCEEARSWKRQCRAERQVKEAETRDEVCGRREGKTA
jgi:hypothetical protein